jgi:hypothetical protein
LVVSPAAVVVDGGKRGKGNDGGKPRPALLSPAPSGGPPPPLAPPRVLTFTPAGATAVTAAAMVVGGGKRGKGNDGGKPRPTALSPALPDPPPPLAPSRGVPTFTPPRHSNVVYSFMKRVLALALLVQAGSSMVGECDPEKNECCMMDSASARRPLIVQSKRLRWGARVFRPMWKRAWKRKKLTPPRLNGRATPKIPPRSKPRTPTLVVCAVVHATRHGGAWRVGGTRPCRSSVSAWLQVRLHIIGDFYWKV